MADGMGNGGGRRWRLVAWGTAGLLILMPLLAMQMTQEVNWTPFDFAFAAGLVLGVGGAFELAVRMSDRLAYRAAFAVALAASFLLIWINGAVGIIGSEDDPANRMFAAVLATGLLGALLARLRPAGMAVAMGAAAAAQVMVAVVAMVTGAGFIWPITVFFAGLWLASATLFRRAARDGSA